MDEQPEQEWPTHCETCGTELESAVVDVVPNSDSEHRQTGSPATVIAQDFCPNPDCPSNASDLAPVAPGQEERLMRMAEEGQVPRENRPGTEGGDNGGG